MARSYEMAIIFDPTLDEDGVEQMMAQIDEMIRGEGGTIDKWDRWPKRRLSFEIKRHTEGHYAFLSFNAEPSAIAKLVPVLRLEEKVLRHMTINMDEWLGK